MVITAFEIWNNSIEHLGSPPATRGKGTTCRESRFAQMLGFSCFIKQK